MKCNHCGAENESGAIFCNNCGKKIEVPAEPRKNLCPHCGAENEEGAVFCDNCGQKMKSTPAPASAPAPKPAPQPSYSQPAPPPRSTCSEPQHEERPFARQQSSYGQRHDSRYLQCGEFWLSDSERIISILLGVGAFIFALLEMISGIMAISYGVVYIFIIFLIEAIGLIIGGIFVMRFAKWAHIILIVLHSAYIVVGFISGMDAATIVGSVFSLCCVIGHVILLIKLSYTTQSTRS